MKKLVVCALLGTLICSTLTACHKTGADNEAPSEVVDIGPEVVEPVVEESTVVPSTVEQQPAESKPEKSKIEFDVPDLTPVEQEETETQLSMYINEVLVTMPLTYADLESQGFSMDYGVPKNVSNGVTRVYDIKESDWIVVRDPAGGEVCYVRDDRSVTNSNIITSDNKIGALVVADSFATVKYFDLVRGQSTYTQVDEVMKQLGFDSVKYINEGMDEYIVGTININGNTCQVWAAISVFEEAGVLKDIYFLNKDVLDCDIADEYSFRNTPYGQEQGGVSVDIPDVITDEIISYTFGGESYSYSNTIKDYGDRGWKVTGMETSETGGTVVLTMKKDGVVMYFRMPSLYVTTNGKKHVFDETAVPDSVTFEKDALSKLDFHGLTGVISETKLKESGISNYLTEESIDGTIFTFDGYGSATFKLLDGYVNSIMFSYER